MNLVSPGAQPAPGTTFPQNQVQLANVATTLVRDQSSNNFTGFDASDTNQPAYPAAIVPASLPGSTLGFHRSLDAEGIRLTSDGTFYTGDEYGPFIYHFIRFGCLLDTIVPPAAFIPKVGSTYGRRVVNFTAATDPDSGRRSNRGLEGLGITDHGRKLVAMLQSPLIQDGGSKKTAQNTRILIFDSRSGKLLHEYVYPLTLNNAGGNTHRRRQTQTRPRWPPPQARESRHANPALAPAGRRRASLAIVSAREDGQEIALGGPRCFQRTLNTSLTFCAHHEASAVSLFPRASQDTRKPLQCRSRGSGSHLDSYAGEQQFGGC
jgi:hypothetical protein